MNDDYKDILETLLVLKQRKDKADVMRAINIIVNTINSIPPKDTSNRQLQRTVKIDKLVIKIEMFGNV